MVGLSGAGKTQVLNAVEYSLDLVVDKDVILRPYRVGMGMLIGEDEYEWYYEINKINDGNLIINEVGRYEFVFKKLLCNGREFFERNNGKVNVIGYDKVPQPKKDESLILQYSEDRNFEMFISGIRKLYSVEIELAVRGGISRESFSHVKAKVKDIIRNEENLEFKTFNHHKLNVFYNLIKIFQIFLVKLQGFVYKKPIIMYNDNNWK